MILQNITCNTSHIEVQYRRLAERAFRDTLSILYTCQDPNGTQVRHIEIMSAAIKIENRRLIIILMVRCLHAVI